MFSTQRTQGSARDAKENNNTYHPPHQGPIGISARPDGRIISPSNACNLVGCFRLFSIASLADPCVPCVQKTPPIRQCDVPSGIAWPELKREKPGRLRPDCASRSQRSKGLDPGFRRGDERKRATEARQYATTQFSPVVLRRSTGVRPGPILTPRALAHVTDPGATPPHPCHPEASEQTFDLDACHAARCTRVAMTVDVTGVVSSKPSSPSSTTCRTTAGDTAANG